MSQGPQKNYLFYSNQCQHSKRLLLQIQKTAIVNNVQINFGAFSLKISPTNNAIAKKLAAWDETKPYSPP